VKHLLDTHVLVWWLTDPRKLARRHARILERAERSGTSVAVSAVSLWEIAKLVERGRIVLTASLDELLTPLESHASLTIFPLTARVAIESTRLGESYPSDPADQIIGATARVHALTLVTADERIIDSGVVSVLAP
jgi:PIN domain nuclease of toxin-antitoxin system